MGGLCSNGDEGMGGGWGGGGQPRRLGHEAGTGVLVAAEMSEPREAPSLGMRCARQPRGRWRVLTAVRAGWEVG